MPETEGHVTCELVGDAKANALNLKVFTIINYMPSFIRNTYCYICSDHLCDLVVRVSGYRYRGPGFDPRRYQIF